MNIENMTVDECNKALAENLGVFQTSTDRSSLHRAAETTTIILNSSILYYPTEVNAVQVDTRIESWDPPISEGRGRLLEFILACAGRDYQSELNEYLAERKQPKGKRRSYISTILHVF